MRNPLPLMSCLAILLLPGLPALAQSRPPAQPISLGLPPEAAEKSSIGFVDVPMPECRPLYASGIQQVGPPTADPEKQTQGMVVAGYACDARR
ncbi:MAG: hypothetical protein EON47_16255 [Acetobacteraceae bacterium]|nr:MAG: hypothetical protein EON47_16255 [Acetobacteraceae bacterium]